MDAVVEVWWREGDAGGVLPMVVVVKEEEVDVAARG